MPLIGPHLLELVDDADRRWTFRLDTESGLGMRVCRDDLRVGSISRSDLHYILREHDDDYFAAQALCSRVAAELSGALPQELKTALFAGLSTWVRRHRVRVAATRSPDSIAAR